MRASIPLRVIVGVLVSTAACKALASSDLDELRAELASLKQQVEMLERRIEAVTDEQQTQTPELPSTRPAITVGGRIKWDAIRNHPSVGGPGGSSRADTAFSPGSIPLGATGENGQLSSSARDSRLWITAIQSTASGPLRAYIELDFVSSDGSGNERVSNSYNPRMRHAYASWHSITAGQTNSTFYNPLAFPEINDANGPVGITLVRQPQIRYSHESDGLTWHFAAEQPESVLDSGTGRLVPDDDRWPDLTARLDFANKDGSWSIATLLRELRIDSTAATDHATGWAVALAGRQFTAGANNLRWSLAGGDGIGRYLSYNAFDDGVLDTSNAIDPVRAIGGYVAYQHWWDPKLRTNIVIGAAKGDTSAPGDTSRLESLHLNLLYSPIPQASLGIEWLTGRRTLNDGSHGWLHRLQFTTLYKFSN